MRKIILFALMVLFVATSASNAKKFRIMTFNIRLLTPVDGENIWANRKDDVAKFIKKTKADVFGLQEATYPQISDIMNGVKNYDYVGNGRDDGQQKGEYSPVFYRKDKYKLIKSGTFWLSETPEEPGKKGWDAACPRVCSWAILQDNKTGKSFVFANTHLDHIGKLARTNGALLIKERLSRMANNLPIMITGDFNVTDEEQSYKTMRERLFPLNDAYKEATKVTGMKSSFHGWGKIADKDGDKIDFIFLSPSLKVKSTCIYDGSLGNGRFISDHHPHYADLDASEL